MKARNLLILVVCIVGLGALIAHRINLSNQKAETVKNNSQKVHVPTISTTKVTRDKIETYTIITGTIRPLNEVDIYSKVAGRIVTLSVDVGSVVKKGQVLATIEPEVYQLQLKQAVAAVEGAKAGVQNAQRNKESAETLAQSQNIADVQLVGARSGLQGAQAQLMQAEAMLDLSKENYKNTRITSPIDGIITKKNVNIGVMVTPSALNPMTALFQVQDRSKLKLDATIDEREIKYVKEDQTVSFQLDAYTDETFYGKVKKIYPTLDAMSRRASVEIWLEDISDSIANKIYTNMFARGKIIQKQIDNVLLIPKTALLKESSTPAVYSFDGSNVHKKDISLGESDEQFVIVENGLSEGDEIVLTGQSQLEDNKQATRSELVEVKKNNTENRKTENKPLESNSGSITPPPPADAPADASK